MRAGQSHEGRSGRELTLWVSLSRSGELFPPFAAAIGRTREGPVRLVATGTVIDTATGLNPDLKTVEIPRIDRRILGLGRIIIASLGTLAKVFRLSHRSTLIHVLMPSPLDILFLMPAKLRGATVLMTVHDAHLHPGEDGAVQDILYRLTRTYADHYVAVSRFVHAALESDAHGKKVFLVPNGLIEDLGSPGLPRTRSCGEPLRLLFHGRIRAYKGLHVLLEAMALLEGRNDITLTIAGEGAHTELKVAAARLPNVHTIFERTSDDERDRLYQDADVNVLPYLEASQSGVAQRGLFAALPSISTNVGALPEQLIDGADCIMIPPDDVPALVSAIEALADSPALYNRLSEGARDAAARLQPDVVARRWNALYDTL